MTEVSLELLIIRFTRAAEQHYQAVESMDEAGANRQATILAGLHASLCRQGAAGEESLIALLQHESPPVAGMAAVYLLARVPELALPVLERLALLPGLLGFRARAALDRWQSGEWDLE